MTAVAISAVASCHRNPKTIGSCSTIDPTPAKPRIAHAAILPAVRPRRQDLANPDNGWEIGTQGD